MRNGTMLRSGNLLAVCPVDRQQQRWPAGLLLSAPRAGGYQRVPSAGALSSSGAAGDGARQQMRAVSRRQPTEEAEHSRPVNNRSIGRKFVGSASAVMTHIVPTYGTPCVYTGVYCCPNCIYCMYPGGYSFFPSVRDPFCRKRLPDE